MDRQLSRGHGRWTFAHLSPTPDLYGSHTEPLHADQRAQVNLHEYQAKQLLAQYGVALPPGEVCDSSEAAKAIAERLLSQGAKLLAVKSQIHAGGRGKGTFKSGYQGGVKLFKTAAEVEASAKAMLGNVLVTKQTGPEGRLVSKLL